jgi:hypothetical protein
MTEADHKQTRACPSCLARARPQVKFFRHCFSLIDIPPALIHNSENLHCHIHTRRISCPSV